MHINVLCNQNGSIGLSHNRFETIHIPIKLFIAVFNITVTSQWARWRLKSPATPFFTQPFIQAQIKITQKLRVTGLCAGNSPVTDEFPAQMANNAENVSIWWRHHEYRRKVLATSVMMKTFNVRLHHPILFQYPMINLFIWSHKASKPWYNEPPAKFQNYISIFPPTRAGSRLHEIV